LMNYEHAGMMECARRWRHMAEEPRVGMMGMRETLRKRTGHAAASLGDG